MDFDIDEFESDDFLPDDWEDFSEQLQEDFII